MSRTVKEKRARFRELHQSGCFILPNPWDVGSARMLESLGFEALASTSTGYAWSTGRPDYAVSRDDVLEHLTTLANSVNLPLNADFEAGFAPDLEGVAENVSRAIAVGVAGLSIEDRIVGESGLYDIATSTERLKAARAAIDQSGEDVILVARTEGLLLDATALKPAIEKLRLSPQRANSKRDASMCWGQAFPAPVWTRCSAPSPTHKCTGRTTGDSVMSLVNL